jgi:hypothetical protein
MATLAGMVPVFLLLGLGALLRRLKVLDDASCNGLNRLVANVALPALFISTIGTAPLESALSPRLMLVAAGVVAAATLGGLALAHAWRLPRTQCGVVAQGAMRGNIVYFTFPLILGLYGGDALRLAAVTSTALIPVMNLLAVAALELYRPPGERDMHIILRVLANPLVESALLGLVLAALHWQPWPWLASTLKTLGDIAFPGALLALGAQLALGESRRLWRPLIGVAGVKLVLMPALAWWLLALLHAPARETAIGVLLMAAPTAVASNAVAADLGGDPELASSCVLATTLLSIATYPAWVLLLGPR